MDNNKKRDTLVAVLQRVHVNEAIILKWGTYCQVLGLYIQSISSTEGYSYSYLIFSSIINYYFIPTIYLVVRVPGYRSRGPGFDSRRYQIF
jgi:hypothetical protein